MYGRRFMDDKIFYSTKKNNEKLCTVQDNLTYILRKQGNFKQMPKTTYSPPYAISTINEVDFNFSDVETKEKLIQIIKLSDEVTIYSASLDSTVFSCKVKLFEDR